MSGVLSVSEPRGCHPHTKIETCIRASCVFIKVGTCEGHRRGEFGIMLPENSDTHTHKLIADLGPMLCEVISGYCASVERELKRG